jgi:hypothetical protein
VRPCGGDDQERRWEIVHRQSGEQTLAPSAAAATDWLLGQVERDAEHPDHNGGYPLATAARWMAGAAIELHPGH